MTQAFATHGGLVLSLDRANVDTDAIIPKQFMKSIQRTGFGANLFDEWRYLDRGEPGQDCTERHRNSDFVLNQARYQGASILLTRANFGCGSSREHAAWALRDFGIRALIAPSFADIFFGNCFKNGMLPITLDERLIDLLFEEVSSWPGYRLYIDLSKQSIHTPSGMVLSFDIEMQRKHRLINGLDDIALTLLNVADIQHYQARRQSEEPWLFNDLQEY